MVLGTGRSQAWEGLGREERGKTEMGMEKKINEFIGKCIFFNSLATVKWFYSSS